MGTQSRSRSHCHQVALSLHYIPVLSRYLLITDNYSSYLHEELIDDKLLFFINPWCVAWSGRWKVDAKGAKVNHSVSRQPILQFVSIKRKDCGEWAIPGVSGHTFFLNHYWWALLISCVFYFKNIERQQPKRNHRQWFQVSKIILWLACFVGDGRSRGAGLSHTAAGVLWGGVELVGSPTSTESKDSWTHH